MKQRLVGLIWLVLRKLFSAEWKKAARAVFASGSRVHLPGIPWGEECPGSSLCASPGEGSSVMFASLCLSPAQGICTAPQFRVLVGALSLQPHVTRGHTLLCQGAACPALLCKGLSQSRTQPTSTTELFTSVSLARGVGVNLSRKNKGERM